MVYVPISTEQLTHLILERNPLRLENAENWRRNILLYEMSRFTREVSSKISELCERDVCVDVIIKSRRLSSTSWKPAPPLARLTRICTFDNGSGAYS